MRDRDQIRWEDWDADADPGRDADDSGWDAEGVVRAPSSRANQVTAIVLVTAFLATIVLCCVAAGAAADLWPEPPPP